MGNNVNGIRDTFYRDLASDYLKYKEKSFLYRYFWQESAQDLLKKVLPRESVEGQLTPKDLRARLCAAMREDRAWTQGLLLRDPPGDGKKERRDFWQELILNDAGYQAGLVNDADYFIWLVAYLAARDIYYKDSGPWNTDGPMWLRLLLRTGLGGTNRDGASKAQTERDINELAQRLRQEQSAGTMEITERLHGLKQRITRNGQARQVEYLPWLTAWLERAALHSKIRTWLQDSGYPLRAEGSAETASKTHRKQDFSMRLFDAYCTSPAGYTFTPRSLSGWHMSGEGFCVLDAEQLEQLLSVLKQRAGDDDNAYLYLPLAVHVESGCVFFLAGKSIYEGVYEHAAKGEKEAYDDGNTLFCFDYLRLNKAFWAAEPGTVGGPFQLQATFHKNAEKSYFTVLNDFKRDCIVGIKNAIDESAIEESVIERVRAMNEEAPAGTPDAFLWAFYPPEEPVVPNPSREGRVAFYQARSNMP